MPCLILYGGTFDPIHLGHLAIANTVQQMLQSDVIFIPCKQPVLKQAAFATEQQRFDILKLAISDNTHFRIDERELQRQTPSYMLDTLLSFRKQYPKSSLILLLGMDAFLSLPQWHKAEQLLELANILVINRSEVEFTPSPSLQQLIQGKISDNHDALKQSTHGFIHFIKTDEYPVSSTQIRQLLANKKSVKYYLPIKVSQYIKEKKLYC